VADIVHEEGYKDEFKVTVYNNDKEGWSPTNRDLFELVEKIFESEEQEFGDGYGNRWLWFYMSMIMLGLRSIRTPWTRRSMPLRKNS